MASEIESRHQLRVLTGNAAAARAVVLCKPDVISAYPITPQTELVEVLYDLIAQGELDCEAVEPEGEHSAMSILLGASLAGARTFTATSAQGLFFMFEPYISAATQRLPIVMVNVNRELLPPTTVSGSGQDIMLVKDAGWIQIHVESCQEIMDSLIMAYKLAEDPDICLPVQVCYDGYFLSYRSEPVHIPPADDVDSFLPRHSFGPTLDPDEPMTAAPFVSAEMLTEYRVKHMAAMQRAPAKLNEIEAEFETIFGRGYGGPVDEYRCEDAEIVLVSMGSCIGTARVIVDEKRDQGVKVGLVKVRMFRPFPREPLGAILRGRKAIGVIDRNVCFGWNCGHLFVEVQSLLKSVEVDTPIVDFIGGLNGGDIRLSQIARAVDCVSQLAEGESCQDVTFLDLE